MNKRFLSLVVLSFLAVGSAWGMAVELPDNHEQLKGELEIITNLLEGFKPNKRFQSLPKSVSDAWNNDTKSYNREALLERKSYLEELIDSQNHEKGVVTNNDSLRRQEQCKTVLGEIIPDELSSRLQRSPARTSSKKKDDRVPNQEGGHADLLQEFKNNQSKQISSKHYTESDTGSVREYSSGSSDDDELVESTDTMKINPDQTTWPSEMLNEGKQEQLETPNDESNPNKPDTLEDIIRDAQSVNLLPKKISGPKKKADQLTVPEVSLPQESQIQLNKTKEENVPLFDQKDQSAQEPLAQLDEKDISSPKTEGSPVISRAASPLCKEDAQPRERSQSSASDSSLPELTQVNEQNSSDDDKDRPNDQESNNQSDQDDVSTVSSDAHSQKSHFSTESASSSSDSDNSESNTHNSDPNAQKTTIQSGKESTLKSANFLDVLRANKWEICAGASVAAVVAGSLWRINQYLSFRDEQNLNQDFLTQLAERVGDYDDEKISKNELLTFFDTHCGELMLINDQDKVTLRNLIVAQKSMELYEMIQSLLPTVKKSAALKTQKMGVMERIQMGVKRDCNTIKHWFGGLYAKIKRIVA